MKWGVTTVRLPHLTDVPQMVTVEVAEREVVLAVVVCHAILHYRISTLLIHDGKVINIFSDCKAFALKNGHDIAVDLKRPAFSTA